MDKTREEILQSCKPHSTLRYIRYGEVVPVYACPKNDENATVAE